jgi:voltage-gated potassium channel
MSDQNHRSIAHLLHQFNQYFRVSIPAVLAIMVAVSSVTLIYPMVHRVWVGEYEGLFDQASSWREIIDAIGLIELPRVFIGLCLLLMSVGLAMRARLAWGFSLMVFVPALIVTIYSQWGIAYPKIIYDLIVVTLLLRYWSLFTRTSLTAGSLFAVASLMSLLWYAMLGSLYLGDQFHPPIKDMPDAVYFSVVAMSTVGFGDIVPVSHGARMFAVSIILGGITVFATSLGAIIGPVVNGKLRRMLRYKARKSMRKNHIIICGSTPLALSLYRSLTERRELVTVIVREDIKHDYPESADLIFGEASDADTLREAGVEQARTVMALRVDDADNAFIVLAVKSFPDVDAKTVVMVNDSQNLEKIRRVNADIVFSPQLLSAELLARALMGEEIDSTLISELFFAKPMPAAIPEVPDAAATVAATPTATPAATPTAPPATTPTSP